MARSKNNLFSTVLVFLLLNSSCSNVVTNAPNPTTIIKNTAIPVSTPTSIPIQMPTATRTVESSPSQLLPPESIVNFQPFDITSNVSSDVKPVGMLGICSDSTIQLLHFVPEMRVETMPGVVGDMLCYGTSPDGNWIAIQQDSNASPTGSWLIIVSADGQQQKKMPMDPNWVDFGDYIWLDNQHLIFDNFINPPDVQRFQPHPAYPTVVVNPFTGKYVELPSDYPGLHLGICGPVGTMAFNYSDIVYDPSLDLVVFPA